MALFKKKPTVKAKPEYEKIEETYDEEVEPDMGEDYEEEVDEEEYLEEEPVVKVKPKQRKVQTIPVRARPTPQTPRKEYIQVPVETPLYTEEQRYESLRLKVNHIMKDVDEIKQMLYALIQEEE